MKKLFLPYVWILCLLYPGIVFSQFNPAFQIPTRIKVQEGNIYLIKPSQVFEVSSGEQVDIEWGKEGAISDNCFKIYLFRNDTIILDLVPKVCVNGYRWQVPSGLPPGSGYSLKVTTLDGSTSAGSPVFAIVSRQADIGIQDFTITPGEPEFADEMIIRATIVNRGQLTAPATLCKLSIDPEGEYATIEKIIEIPRLDFGGHFNIKEVFSEVAVGNITIQLVADIENTVAESSETDNIFNKTVMISPSPNLVACISEKRYAQVLTETSIQAIITNMSHVRTKDTIMVAFWIEGKGTRYFSIPPLDGIKKAILIRKVKFDDNGDIDYKVTIDPDNTIRENNESDNEVSGIIKRTYDLLDITCYDDALAAPYCPEQQVHGIYQLYGWGGYIEQYRFTKD